MLLKLFRRVGLHTDLFVQGEEELRVKKLTWTGERDVET